MGADVVDGEDVGVVEGPGGPGLLLEAEETVAIGDLLGEDLDRDLAAEAGVTGAVDLAHSPRAEQPHDLVRTESGACLESHRYTPRAAGLSFNEDRLAGLVGPSIAGLGTRAGRTSRCFNGASLRRKIHAATRSRKRGSERRGSRGRPPRHESAESTKGAEIQRPDAVRACGSSAVTARVRIRIPNLVRSALCGDERGA